MKNNRLCAELALSLCLFAVPVSAQAGSSGAASLHEAAQRGDVAVVRRLLAAGVNVNALVDDIRRETPLHWAARKGHEVVVRVLLEAGAAVNATGGGGETPLQRASGWGHGAVVQLLLEAGANVNAAGGPWGDAPLCLAARRGDEAIVRQLLAAGADVDAVSSGGNVPLHWAARKGHDVVVRQLLEAGADVNAVNKWGDAPLHWVARDAHEADVRSFSARGAVPLTQAACKRIISNNGSFGYYKQWQRARLNQLQPVTEQASLERKQAIESTLDEVKIDSERLPRDLQELIIKMSEHPDVLAWWQQNDRLRAMSRMRLPDELLEYIVTFDSPQDIRVFQNMLE